MSTYYPFIAALSANIIAQILKPIIARIVNGKWHLLMAKDSGGFPSSHTAAVVSLMIAIGIQDGVNSSVFALSFVFALIVCYDAANVRYYAGQNIQVTQQLIKDIEAITKVEFNNPLYLKQIKQVLGHKWIEVFGGVIVGLLVACVLSLFR